MCVCVCVIVQSLIALGVAGPGCGGPWVSLLDGGCCSLLYLPFINPKAGTSHDTRHPINSVTLNFEDERVTNLILRRHSCSKILPPCYSLDCCWSQTVHIKSVKDFCSLTDDRSRHLSAGLVLSLNSIVFEHLSMPVLIRSELLCSQ